MRITTRLKMGSLSSLTTHNHRRPHQGIGFAGPYQKLTGQEKRIIKERRTRALAAQKVRKIENRKRKI